MTWLKTLRLSVGKGEVQAKHGSEENELSNHTNLILGSGRLSESGDPPTFK